MAKKTIVPKRSFIEKENNRLSHERKILIDLLADATGESPTTIVRLYLGTTPERDET